MPDVWAIRAIDQNVRDRATELVDPQGTNLDGVAIALTNRFPILSGSLRDEKGNGVVIGTVIIFPDEAALWVEDLRTVRTARVDQAGLFTIKAIRPGQYLPVAVPTVHNNPWHHPG